MQIRVRRFGERFKLNSFQVLFIVIKNSIASRELIWQLFKRDLLMANKRSYLGIIWSFIAPIFGIISWVFMNIAGVLQPGNTGVPFPVFLLAGSMIYGYFGAFIGVSRGILGAGGGFIMQVEYHHESLFFYNLLNVIFWSTFTFVLNVLVFLLFGLYPHITWLLFPFLLIPLLLFGSAIGFVLLVLDKAFPDLAKVFNMAIGLIYWITPIVFSVDAITNPYILAAIRLNPLYYLVILPRDMFLFGHSTLWQGYFIMAGISAVLFMLGLRFYYLTENTFIERI
ncbi:MAG: ABC transporter permease [Spirochaetaceae bacterium]|nr:ABC transporter permease [Spirochaetaceae bacterium]